MIMPHSTVIAIFRARPGCADALGAQLDRLGAIGRAGPGCQNYAVRRADGDPATWLLHARWRSPDDAAAFFSAPAVGDVVDDLAPLIAGDIGLASFVEDGAYPRLAA
jgi:quinol monooxygenase YgiN